VAWIFLGVIALAGGGGCGGGGGGGYPFRSFLDLHVGLKRMLACGLRKLSKTLYAHIQIDRKLILGVVFYLLTPS
jgi:hypothetical protein